MVYAQHEVLKDLIARRLDDGGDVRFWVTDTPVDGIDSDRPTIRFTHEGRQERVGVFRPGGARPSTQVKLCYIHAYRHRFGVEPICAVLSEHDMKIAPQTYYRWLARPIRPTELEEACERHREPVSAEQVRVRGAEDVARGSPGRLLCRAGPGRSPDAHSRHPGCAPRRPPHRHHDPRRARTAAP